MKKTTKKSPSKASHKKAVKNLEVKPAKGRTVRGGDKTIPMRYGEIEWTYTKQKPDAY
jgi:hypothetical protein